MIAQIEKIQNLKTLLASIQSEQQANSALNVDRSVQGCVPVSITKGDTTLTKKSM